MLVVCGRNKMSKILCCFRLRILVMSMVINQCDYFYLFVFVKGMIRWLIADLRGCFCLHSRMYRERDCVWGIYVIYTQYFLCFRDFFSWSRGKVIEVFMQFKHVISLVLSSLISHHWGQFLFIFQSNDPLSLSEALTCLFQLQ